MGFCLFVEGMGEANLWRNIVLTSRNMWGKPWSGFNHGAAAAAASEPGRPCSPKTNAVN